MGRTGEKLDPVWRLPPEFKVYEALTAVADGRVHLADAHRAEVTSSSGDKTYTVTWSEDGSTFSSNDNASYWRRYAGYPIIAVLLATGRIGLDRGLARLLSGIPWKRLNDEAGRHYEAVVERVLQGVEETGGDRAALAAEVGRIHAQLAALELRRGPRGAPPVPDRTTSTKEPS